MVAIRDVRKVVVAAALAVVGATSLAYADEPSGTAVDVVPLARADGTAGFRVLVDQGSVYSGDKIVTGPVGQAQILFRDNTKLVVGPNSSMTIDAFVYSGKSGAQKVSIDAVKGAFRFITGISKKDAYSISTPTAVIAVRGTEFDMHVDRVGGETEVVMFGGATLICPKTLPDGSPNTKGVGCVRAQVACNMTIIPPGGDNIAELKPSVQRNNFINRDFRYIRNQNTLNADFRVNLGHCGGPGGIQNTTPTTPASSGQNAAPSSPGEGGGGD
jgi:hypothetical protein